MSKVVIITGSRDWPMHGQLSVWRALSAQEPALVVHGGCESGVDEMAERWCRRMQVDSRIFRAKWGERPDIDRSAGPKRNRRMIAACAEHYPDAVVLAFPMGNGGTEDCMRRAQFARFEVIVHGLYGEPKP